MRQVNIFQAKTELSRLIALLESEDEDEIVIARNGKPVARILPWVGKNADKRIGVAEGLFVAPDDFDDLDGAIASLFMGGKE
jgi:antitoxin (DNA-binding transcriptional repressor) of toxin-antitoxin stability system